MAAVNWFSLLHFVYCVRLTQLWGKVFLLGMACFFKSSSDAQSRKLYHAFKSELMRRHQYFVPVGTKEKKSAVFFLRVCLCVG